MFLVPIFTLMWKCKCMLTHTQKHFLNTHHVETMLSQVQSIARVSFFPLWRGLLNPRKCFNDKTWVCWIVWYQRFKDQTCWPFLCEEKTSALFSRSKATVFLLKTMVQFCPPASWWIDKLVSCPVSMHSSNQIKAKQHELNLNMDVCCPWR